MSENRCRVRPFSAADLDRVVQLDKNLGGELRPGFFEKRLQSMGHAPDQHIGLVSAVDDELCGYLFAHVLQGEFGRQQPVAVLDALGVQPGEQGSGVGIQLMAELKKQASDLGCGALQTQAEWSQQELLAYFSSTGFSLAGRNVLKRDTAPLATDSEDSGTELRPVRSLSADDLNAIARIDRHITGEDRSEYLKSKVDEVISDTGVRVSMVAEQDGLVAGYIMARLDYGSFGRASANAVVDTIGIGPEYKGQGIGSALMGQLLDNLASLQVEGVRTQVEWDNAQLNGFLARCGFQQAQQLSLSCPL